MSSSAAASACAAACSTIRGDASSLRTPGPGAGQQHREAPGAAAEVDDLGRRIRQLGGEECGAGGAGARVAQTVVGLVVEAGGLGVPVADAVLAHRATSTLTWPAYSREPSKAGSDHSTSAPVVRR